MAATKKAAAKIAPMSLDGVKVGDTLNVEVTLENIGAVDLKGGTLTGDQITWSAGEGYTQQEKTATITDLKKNATVKVKGTYTTQDGDKESGVTLKATFTCGAVNVSCESENIAVTEAV